MARYLVATAGDGFGEIVKTGTCSDRLVAAQAGAGQLAFIVPPGLGEIDDRVLVVDLSDNTLRPAVAEMEHELDGVALTPVD